MTAAPKVHALAVAASVLTALTTLGASADAQTFRGVVVDDSTRAPLASVAITLVDSRGRDIGRPAVRSDSAGRFIIHASAGGEYALRASRIGYEQLTSAPVSVVIGEAVAMNLAMSIVAQRLGSVVVEERRRLNGDELLSHLGFDLRRSAANGKFLDSLSLAPFKGQPVNLLLEEHGGLGVHLVIPTPCGPRERDPFECTRRADTLVMTNGMEPTGRPRYCGPELWIDGQLQPSSFFRLRGMDAADVHGIEVFSALQLPPAGLAGALGSEQSLKVRTARCGVIVVWTKRYINELKRKEKIPP